MLEIAEAGTDQDVRRVMAELRHRGEPDVEMVPWARFHHAYGTADDVPAMLRMVSDPDPARAQRARRSLWNKTRHQGISETALALAVPFLIRIAIEPAVHDRPDLLRLAAEAGRRDHFGGDTRSSLFEVVEIENPGDTTIDGYGRPVAWTWQAAREALAADAPLLIGLLADPDPLVRLNAAYALSAALPAPAEIVAALRRRLATETNPPVRITLVLAYVQLATEHDDHETIAWADRQWADANVTPDVRFAAALAWLAATQAPLPGGMIDMFTDVMGPELATAMRFVPWHDYAAGDRSLTEWLADFLEVGHASDLRKQA